MDIELKARERLTWLKDNWVEDWEEPHRHETKYAIEDIFKILDERKAQLDSKDKIIEELKEENINKGNKINYMAETVLEKENVIELMANHIRNMRIINYMEVMTKEEIIRELENEAKRENNTL